MSIDASRSGVATTVANYFSDNYEALLLSSAAQQPLLPLAPQAWKDLTNATTGVSNANSRFFLRQDGTLQAVSRSASQVANWTPPANSTEVDLNVAYGIQNAGLSGTDWLMQRIADEFRLNNSTSVLGPALSLKPEPELEINLSSLDTASLVRLLNMLTGRAKDGQRETAIGNAHERNTKARSLGLSASNLSNALELQGAFNASNGSNAVNNAVGSLLTGDDSTTRDVIANAAVARLVEKKGSELEAARLAFGSTAISKLDDKQSTRLIKIAGNGLDAALQGAADIALMQNPYLPQFGSVVDDEQNNNGLAVKSTSGATRDQQVAQVKAALKEALKDPALRQDLIDAMASNADELGTADLPIDEQYKLYGEVADMVIEAALSDDAYLEQLASQSVQFQIDITHLVSNEVDAAHERDSTFKNV